MQISAKELAHLLNGTIEGNPDVQVHAPSKIEEGQAGTISFLANPKYETYAYTTKASILLVSRDFEPSQAIEATLIRVDDVYASITFLLEQFGNQQGQKPEGIHENAFVHASAKLGDEVSVGIYAVIENEVAIGEGTVVYPQVFIGKNVKIGKHVRLYPGVKIYQDCVIGDHCIIHSNAIIGSDGFGFMPQDDGSYKKIPQLGNVLLEEQVEVGANTVIDRATMGSTIIRKGVKLDNLIQIAHNVEIDQNTVIAAQAGIAGSTKVGKGVQIGGQVGLVGHIQVADGTRIQAQSGVNKSIKKENSALYGSPALNYNDYLRAYAVYRKLPTLLKRIEALEKEVKKLSPS